MNTTKEYHPRACVATRCHAATAHKPARISARAGNAKDFPAVFVSRHSMEPDHEIDCHAIAAQAFINKYHLDWTLYGAAGSVNGGYVFVTEL